MSVDTDDRNPAPIIVVPDGPERARNSQILFPEHVTVRAHGQSEQEHLYANSHLRGWGLAQPLGAAAASWLARPCLALLARQGGAFDFRVAGGQSLPRLVQQGQKLANTETENELPFLAKAARSASRATRSHDFFSMVNVVVVPRSLSVYAASIDFPSALTFM